MFFSTAFLSIAEWAEAPSLTAVIVSSTWRGLKSRGILLFLPQPKGWGY